LRFGNAIKQRIGARPNRIDAVDLVRGIAIVGVVVYHFFWDLSLLWLIETDVSTHPLWVLFARSLLFSFVFLAGVGLVLSHGEGIRWPSFWRRLAIIGGAALLVTIGTVIAFPETFVYFGVLHAIVLFSVIGLAFLRLNPLLTLAIGAAIFAAPYLWTSEIFEAKPLSWIGFWAVHPPTNDLVPIFPWFGATLIGVGLAKLARERGLFARLSGWQARGPLRVLAVIGRLTLPIYLIHQPVLLALLTPLASTAMAPVANLNSFNRTCQSGCEDTGASAQYCTTYCACMLDTVETENLWDAVTAPEPTAEQSQAINTAILSCSVEDLPTLETLEETP
jgi:uncharacterized membrane protein